MNRAAIVLTHNRPELLAECVAAIGPQVDVVLVIDNASQPAVTLEVLAPGFDDQHRVVLMTVPDQPPNLARLWNLGIDALTEIRGGETGPWWIGFLCDDAITPPGWFQAVVDGMTQTGAAAGCSNPWGNQHPPQVKTEMDSDLMGRLVGWAFVLDAFRGLRADESMMWWWLDSDLDIQARHAGGMVMVGGFPVPNRLPNDYTCSKPELGQQAGDDGRTFEAKWGRRPW
jgi:glycosyltransferase involved in cell wall biosynthesis